MIKFRDEVNYQWQRRSLLARYRAGAVSRASLCDAEFLLVEASKYHGTPVGKPCPVCGGSRLRSVLWVYGDAIGRVSGSARSLEEIEQFVAKRGPFTVHTVEVCPDCRWNHLLTSRTATLADEPEGASVLGEEAPPEGGAGGRSCSCDPRPRSPIIDG